MNFFAYLAMSCDSALIVPRVKHFSALHSDWKRDSSYGMIA